MFYRNEIQAAMPAPRRQHYSWEQMEEYQPDGGMWAIPTATHRERHIDAAEQLMLSPASFKRAMRQALRDWPRSVAVALTTPGLNYKAWLGHAGCYLATGSPEETTRIAWHRLDDGEQWAANDAAQSVINEWREAHSEGQQATLFDLIPSLSDWEGTDA
jgi:hypothetical protein